MESTGDDRQAQALADKIVNDGDRGVAPSAADLKSLAGLVEPASREVAEALRRLGEKGSDVSVEDMFEMQMLMNQYSQLSEMSSSVMSSANAAISSMARNVK